MPKGYVKNVAPPPPLAAPSPLAKSRDENADWFKRLPAQAQDEYRAQWLAEDERSGRRAYFARSTLQRSLLQGALLFFCVETFCGVPSVLHSLAALAVGAGLGLSWHRYGAGRFRCVVTSAGPYAVLRVVFGIADGGDERVVLISAVIGFVMLTSFAALIGFSREMRRSSDQDY